MEISSRERTLTGFAVTAYNIKGLVEVESSFRHANLNPIEQKEFNTHIHVIDTRTLMLNLSHHWNHLNNVISWVVCHVKHAFTFE